jgi:hypothetical protein
LGPGGGPDPAAESRAAALLVLSALYGALIMARAVGDSPLSNEILDTVRKQILSFGAPVKKARVPVKIQRGRK